MLNDSEIRAESRREADARVRECRASARSFYVRLCRALGKPEHTPVENLIDMVRDLRDRAREGDWLPEGQLPTVQGYFWVTDGQSRRVEDSSDCCDNEEAQWMSEPIAMPPLPGGDA